MLSQVALGVALAEADRGTRETDGPNEGPRIREYLANVDPPIHHAAPWCAAAVQYWADLAAHQLGMDNPLDEVRLEALVQSYADWAHWSGGRVWAHQVEPGDLVLYSFGGRRFDHIGIVVRPPDEAGRFLAVEGNTDADGGREGVEVAVRSRILNPGMMFVRWDES